MSAKGEVGAFAAILNDECRILIVQERKESRRFGFPGGRVEPNEAPEEAVVRECREETGLDVRVMHRIGS